MGRNKFAEDEIKEIAKLLRLKNAGNRAKQKLVRHDLRTIYEFNISDFNEPGKAFGEEELQDAIQRGAIQILEGTVASVPPTGGRKHPQQELIHIDTTNILFICGGAFVGLDKIVADRIGKKGIGFNSDVAQNVKEGESELIAKVMPQDLHRFLRVQTSISQMVMDVQR